jgi:hypothetical protein
MLIQPQVGPLATTASLAAGQQPPVRAGNMGDLIVSELHGRYYESAYRRSMFSAANQAVTATSAGLSTTYTGICLSNPINSTVNLVVGKVGWSLLVVQAAVSSISLACGYNSGTNVTHTTPITPRSNYFNNATTGQGLVDAAATLPTAPVYTHILGSALTGAVTVQTQAPAFYDLEGSLILPPGGYTMIAMSTVSAASSFWGSIAWEEVPL